MCAAQSYSPPGQNHLLAALLPEQLEALVPDLEPVALAREQAVVRAGEPFAAGYFPISGLYSARIATQPHRVVEVTAVGNEGMLGVPAFLGTERSREDVVCEVAGAAWRMEVAAFRQHAQAASALHELLLRYTGLLLTVSRRQAACNGAHPAEARLARWLLQVRDCLGADEFELLTQFLADMLGVPPARVRPVVAILRKDGRIRYQRQRFTVLDAQRLEAGACEDYRIVRGEYERLLGPIWNR
jgi:CRP-like cAMP-binding protein